MNFMITLGLLQQDAKGNERIGRCLEAQPSSMDVDITSIIIPRGFKENVGIRVKTTSTYRRYASLHCGCVKPISPPPEL
jgi:hypothetical protein